MASRGARQRGKGSDAVRSATSRSERTSLGGETLLIVGLRQIGGRLAQLAKAFDMRVIAATRAGAGQADALHATSDLGALLPQTDFVALTCPLTAETEKLIDADALGRMKPSAYLLNAARRRAVDEPALVNALARAALDVTVEEAAVRSLAAVGHGARADYAKSAARLMHFVGECDPKVTSCGGVIRLFLGGRGSGDDWRSKPEEGD